MSLLDYINPFNKIVDRASNVIDEVVLDKDKALEIKAQLQLAQNEYQRDIERSYQVALQTKTIPLLDGIHKLGRQLLSVFVLVASYRIIGDWNQAGVSITFDHVMLLVALSGPTAVYHVLKGRGKP